MADTNNTAAASKLGFLPKLLLWSLVLLFGYLYLGAVERHGSSTETAADDAAGGQVSAVASTGSDGVVAGAEQTATSPAAQQAASSSGSAPTIPPALAAPSVAVAPPPVAAVKSAPAPIAPPPAPKPASALVQSERATPPAGPVAGAASEGSEHQVSKAEAEAFAHAVMQKPPQAAAAAAPPAPVSAAPVATSALTPPAVQQPAPQMPSFAVPQQPMQAMPAPMQRPGVVPSNTAEGSAATGAQRAMSDYEARRRQAMQEARQRWEQAYRMRPAAPAPYYGYPGYYPPRATVPAPQQQQPSD